MSKWRNFKLTLHQTIKDLNVTVCFFVEGQIDLAFSVVHPHARLFSSLFVVLTSLCRLNLSRHITVDLFKWNRSECFSPPEEEPAHPLFCCELCLSPGELKVLLSLLLNFYFKQYILITCRQSPKWHLQISCFIRTTVKNQTILNL